MLRESGLQELEERVLGFLCTNSGSLKLLSTLDDAQRLLQQVPPDSLLSLMRMPVMPAVLTIHLAICTPSTAESSIVAQHGPQKEGEGRGAQPGDLSEESMSVGAQRGSSQQCCTAAGCADAAGGDGQAAD